MSYKPTKDCQMEIGSATSPLRRIQVTKCRSLMAEYLCFLCFALFAIDFERVFSVIQAYQGLLDANWKLFFAVSTNTGCERPPPFFDI